MIWLIGLSGAGKTTVGRCLYEKLKPSCPNLVLLDGDLLREVWGDNLGHTVAARGTNAHRISHLARMLDRQGIHVVAAVMSMFPEWLAWNRKHFSAYFEVFLDAPMELLRQRDTKGLYAAASPGNRTDVVGVNIRYPRPDNPDLTLHGDQLEQSPDSLAERILSEVTCLPEFGS